MPEMQVHQRSWETRAKAKVAETNSKIPNEWRLNQPSLDQAKQMKKLSGPFIESFLNDEELFIIRNDSTLLVEKVKTGEYTALQVAQAFCKTAAIAHQINNCLHEIFFEQALYRTKELDEYYKLHGSTMGPLHGLPISLKDQYHVKDTDTTMGYVGWIGNYEGDKNPEKVHKVESQIIEELLSLGAVLYCKVILTSHSILKTSLPQTLLFGETANNLIGRTLNPVNQLLSCGGSSGGEAALQALRGSTVGLGTDIGGSVRIPAAFCGIFSLKPTPGRLSYRNVANTVRRTIPFFSVLNKAVSLFSMLLQNPGQNTYPSTVGVLGTSLDALKLVVTSILSTQPWLRDPWVINIPWRQDIVDSTLARASSDGSANKQVPLKLGVFWTDHVVGPQPPILRGLRTVSKTLEKAGHKIVDWNPPSQSTAKRVHLAFLKADGAHDIHKQLDLSGEPLIPQLREAFRLRDPIPLLAYQDLTIQGRLYEAAYSDYWNSTVTQDGQVVDAVIMPVAPHAAVIPGKYYHTAYTECINLLNYSVCVIPVSTANKDIDVIDKGYRPLNENDRKNWEACKSRFEKAGCLKLRPLTYPASKDDPDIYDGAPIGVQIVARKHEEEKIWAIAKIVTAALKTAGVR
ncbi:hypothetical protein MMC22_010527 [Lobaria immixta]|nr:hypothetical protein [Lobaria immixta]